MAEARTMDKTALEAKNVAELQEIAGTLGVEGLKNLRKGQLIVLESKIIGMGPVPPHGAAKLPAVAVNRKLLPGRLVQTAPPAPEALSAARIRVSVSSEVSPGLIGGAKATF